jgi:cardiolipin synthase
MDDRITEAGSDLADVSRAHGTPPWLPSVAHLNQTLGAMRLLEGNDARLLTDFDDQFAAMVAAANAAQRYLHVEYYDLCHDATTAPFFAALGAAVQRGVTVRVLLDHLGSRPYPSYCRSRRELDRLGVQWPLTLPVQPHRGRYQRPDLRNHRKLLVADGDLAYVGSLNLIDPSYDKAANARRGLVWKDLVVEVRGPVVHEVDAVFTTDWYSETDELLATSQERSTPVQRQGGLLTQVAPSGPAILHSKHLSVDEQVAVIGSSNMDIRSFQLTLEVMLMICGRGFVDEMRTVEDEYRRVSRELAGQGWARRSRLHGLVDDLTRLTSAVQ